MICYRYDCQNIVLPLVNRLSVPAQMIAWKDTSLKWHYWTLLCRAERKTILKHSHTLANHTR